MPHSAFQYIHTLTVPTLNVDFEEYRHIATGARHFHIKAEDNNNAFLVAFLTVPENSKGVAHILEHTTLCGSERYPVRDPFFMMIRRSLNTFMNAFTSSDWTAYPFASQNKKDFNNLLQVYLDATFFPNLNELDFAQEGHRIEFSEPNNTDSPLTYKGVVYNEMKGAMSSPMQTLWQHFSAALFPNITYHHNSGGQPLDIPSLSYAELKQFHATHYHPSNAVFMTYGDLPVEEHQAYFEECALSRFQQLDIDLSIPDETRYTAPVNHEAVYAIAEEEDTAEKTHIVLGWLLDKSTDLRAVMEAHLLAGILLNNSASPLRQALETSKLGSAPSPLSGSETDTREMLFVCGMEGSDPEHADAVEKLILDVLTQVATEGLPQAQVESVLHQIELSQREITGDGYPYGLRLMLQALSPAMHGGDPLKVLDIDPVLADLREAIKNPDFIKQLVQKHLLDNQHRVRLVMRPDATLNAKELEIETQRLAEIKANLTPADTQALLDKATALEARQNNEDDPELLPKVGLEDVPDSLRIAEGTQRDLPDLPATWYAQGTNGMVYQQLIIDLPELDDDLLELLPIFCDCLTEMGVGDKDYLAVQTWQSAVSGSIGASISVRGGVEDIQQVKGIFVLGGKALVRNHAALSELLQDTFENVRFDEAERLRELITQMRLDSETSISDRGSQYAMAAACQGLCPSAALNNRWGGLPSITSIKILDKAIEDVAALQDLIFKLTALRNILQLAPRQLLVVSEAAQQEMLHADLSQRWLGHSNKNVTKPFALSSESYIVREAWRTSAQVNFSAKVYPAVAYNHADAPALTVLGPFLRNGFLHRAIREQGGAYGGGAGYDANSSAFRFFSYRDPRLSETLEDFDASLVWLQEHKHEARTLEEAILNVIAQIDKPGSPAGEAKGAFFSQLYGRGAEKRRAFRSQILNLTLADLQRVGKTYLQAEKASIAVVSHAAALDGVAETLGLEVKTL